jgi:hypothetical protein
MFTNRMTARGTQMDASRRTALFAGIWFVITFITSIPALLLFDPVLNDANYIVGAGADNRIFTGAFLELLLIVANIATALVLFPALKRTSENLALGFVAARIMESAFIAVGILSVLAVVAMRQDVAGAGIADDATLVAIGKALVAVKDLTFLLGPGFVVGIGNGMLLGYLMYRSGLLPRRMHMLGRRDATMLLTSFVLTLFGVYENGSGPSFLLALPEIVWEASLGIYAAWKGFRRSPITDTIDVRRDAIEPSMSIA